MHGIEHAYPNSDDCKRPCRADGERHVRNLVALHAISKLEISARKGSSLVGYGCFAESACAARKTRKALKVLDIRRQSGRNGNSRSDPKRSAYLKGYHCRALYQSRGGVGFGIVTHSQGCTTQWQQSTCPVCKHLAMKSLQQHLSMS